MKANTVGDYLGENVLRDQFLLNSGEDLVTVTPSLQHLDGIGIVIAIEDAVRTVTANGTTDNVDQSSSTWEFENGSFGQGDVGATFVVSGSAEGNDGTYTIDTVTDETHIVSVEAPTADETFTEDVSIEITDTPLQATLGFEVSNDFVRAPGRDVPTLQKQSDGHWADITSSFSPAFEDITVAGNQYAQAYPLVARNGRLTISPTAGASLVSIFYCAKGNR